MPAVQCRLLALGPVVIAFDWFGLVWFIVAGSHGNTRKFRVLLLHPPLSATQPPALNLYKYDGGSQHVLLFVLFAASAVATKFIHNGFFTALQPLLQRPLLLPLSSHPLAGYIVYINFAFLRKLKFIMAQRSNL